MARKNFFRALMLLVGFGLVTASVRAQAAGFVYVANYLSNNVSGYTIDGTTGALMPVFCGVDPCRFPAGSFPHSVTVDPTGRFAYVANERSFDVSEYTVDGTTGALTPIDSSVPTGGYPQSVTVDPMGRLAYVTTCGIMSGGCSLIAIVGEVWAYTIDGASGALTPLFCGDDPCRFPAGSAPRSLAVDPTGRFAYVANDNSGNVSGYNIDGTSGTLTEIMGPNPSPFLAGAEPKSATADPTGRFVYVANCGSGAGLCSGGPASVSAYTIDQTTGALMPIPDSESDPAAILSFWVTVDPTGRFAYVANCGQFCVFGGFGDVSQYTINGTTGALRVIGPPVQAGTGPQSVTVDPTGRFAYVANYTSNDVSAYTINQTTGALTPLFCGDDPCRFPAGLGPISVTATAGPAPLAP